MAAQFDYDVFLSYGPRDRIAATDLQEALEERGLVVWRGAGVSHGGIAPRCNRASSPLAPPMPQVATSPCSAQ